MRPRSLLDIIADPLVEDVVINGNDIVHVALASGEVEVYPPLDGLDDVVERGGW